jgi:hypothetical protein
MDDETPSDRAQIDALHFAFLSLVKHLGNTIKVGQLAALLETKAKDASTDAQTSKALALLARRLRAPSHNEVS